MRSTVAVRSAAHYREGSAAAQTRLTGVERISRSLVAAQLASIASIAMGVVIMVLAPFRGRSGETVAGALVVVVSCVIGVVIQRSSTEQRPAGVLLALGWTLQLGACLVYYYSDAAVDAAYYHGLAESLENGSLRFAWPETRWGNVGIAVMLSWVYRMTGSSMLLGFVVFGLIGLTGKYLVARALLRERLLLGRGSDWGALVVMGLPSLNIWLAAISKESIAVLGIGLAVGGLVRGGRAANFPMILAGIAVVATVRAHVALLLAAALVAHQVLTFALPRRVGGRRYVPLAASGTLLVVATLVAAAYLGSGAAIGELEQQRLALAGVTAPGGSTFVPTPVTSLASVPAAVANVILRPFPWEASSATTAAQSVETAVLVIAAIVAAFRRRLRLSEARVGPDAIRIRALRAFSSVYGVGFVYAFSVFYNLGLISRQRAQLWPPLLVLLATGAVHVGRWRPPIAHRRAAVAGISVAPSRAHDAERN